MNKFNRNFRLTVEAQASSVSERTTDPETIIITPPLTVEFDIIRNTLSSTNIGSIRIYNLSEKRRSQIRQDAYLIERFRRITFQAGYGDRLSTLFDGNVNRAWSFREGNNFVTQIESFDGGAAFTNAKVNKTIAAGTPIRSIILEMVDAMKQYGISRGNIGEYLGVADRGNAFSDTPMAIIKYYAGNGFFVDNMKACCLNDLEVRPGTLSLIDSQSGLLGTPLREVTAINLDMLFEPQIVMGQQITLNSQSGDKIDELNKRFGVNGTYKVTSIHHKGMISGAVCGDAITSLGLLAASRLRLVS